MTEFLQVAGFLSVTIGGILFGPWLQIESPKWIAIKQRVAIGLCVLGTAFLVASSIGAYQQIMG